jgi:hypothetical protein
MLAPMAEARQRLERDDAARREALRTLESLRDNNEGVGSSAFERAARRASDHFAARDTPAGHGAVDSVELWGRRIGRGLSLVAFVGLAIYLYVTYIAR